MNKVEAYQKASKALLDARRAVECWKTEGSNQIFLAKFAEDGSLSFSYTEGMLPEEAIFLAKWILEVTGEASRQAVNGGTTISNSPFVSSTIVQCGTASSLMDGHPIPRYEFEKI